MSLGAYSIVRYSDDLGDQRINLGVVVWHPVDGYRCRISPSIDRVQAIDPRVTVSPLKRQLEDIRESVTNASATGADLLSELCNSFRHGLVISTPYPAKISSVEETLNRLYGLLVSPVPEIRRASSQRLFEKSLKKTIEFSMQTDWPKGHIEQLGVKTVKGISVNLGMRTQIGQSGRAALWHPLSLQSEGKVDAQMVSAKATILDIFQTRGIEQYKRDKQYVAVQAPRAKSASKFEEVVSSLEHAADRVFVANDDLTLVSQVQKGLRALENSAGRHARVHG